MLKASATVKRNVDTAAAVGRGVTDGLLDAADTGFEVSQDRVPVDRGTLLQSGFPPQTTREGAVEWGYRAAHAVPMEEDTAPFTPPLQPLLDWGRRVLGSEGAGAAVWQKIRREGIDAQPYVGPGIDAQNAKLRARGLGQYIARAVSSFD